jgi:glycosyltransferase involved in cell wall biosynthesis
MTSLYLCYQSLLDPLTQTQVVAYLEGLARAGWQPILVTFEPKRLSVTDVALWTRRLSVLGIDWRHLRYHKRPTVPATAFDIACGVALGIWLIVRYRVRLIHARSHVPAVMAALLSALMKRPYLFDIRGFLAEEYADAQVWPIDGFLFRWTKKVERVLIERANGLVVLTESAAVLLRQWYPEELREKPMEVIPCCVDRRFMSAPESREDEHATAGISPERNLVYVGKLGGWYPTGPMVEFFAAAHRNIPGLRWTVLTQSDPSELQIYAKRLGVESLITIGRASPENLFSVLRRCHAGLCFYHRDRSAAACSPTKIPEYLAAGLPIVASRGVGDVDRLLCCTEDAGPIGVPVDDRDPRDLERAAANLMRLVEDPETHARCQATAKQYFDLEAIGWTRYRRIYEQLIGHPRSDRTSPYAEQESHSRSEGLNPMSAAKGTPWLGSS